MTREEPGYIPYDMAPWVNRETGEPYPITVPETYHERQARELAEAERKEKIRKDNASREYERKINEKITILEKRIEQEKKQIEELKTALKIHREMR